MPAVVECPACRQRARVPEAMLGTNVKCPACGATFTAPAGTGAALPVLEPSAAAPTAAVQEQPPRPPLPADPDALRSVQAGVGLQQLAHGLSAGGVAAFLLTALVAAAGTAGSGSTSAPPAVMGLAILAGALLLGIGAVVGLVGGALCVLAPPARLARGLAIAALLITALSAQQLLGSFSWFLFAWEGYSTRGYGGPGGPWVAGFTPLAMLWVYETARLTVLALFWRAGFLLLYDRPGATTALRLALVVPAASLAVFAVVLMLALGSGPGGAGSGAGPALLVGGLGVLLALLGWGVIVAGRLRRRLRAVVPPA
jgi:predicted Zn finger-like uncharacterized protein